MPLGTSAYLVVVAAQLRDCMKLKEQDNTPNRFMRVWKQLQAAERVETDMNAKVATTSCRRGPE